ncbi:MAG: hypothetical protein Q9184_003595 [Pyrenodesmia sp. 2 TL-2023]
MATLSHNHANPHRHKHTPLDTTPLLLHSSTKALEYTAHLSTLHQLLNERIYILQVQSLYDDQGTSEMRERHRFFCGETMKLVVKAGTWLERVKPLWWEVLVREAREGRGE